MSASGAEQEILRRLANIELQVTSLDESTAFGMRPNREKLLAEVDQIFGNSKRKAQAYLAANGRRALKDICAHIRATNNNVSPLLAELEQEGLLAVHMDNGNKYYSKKAIDRTLKISRHLATRFCLTPDGLPGA